VLSSFFTSDDVLASEMLGGPRSAGAYVIDRQPALRVEQWMTAEDVQRYCHESMRISRSKSTAYTLKRTVPYDDRSVLLDNPSAADESPDEVAVQNDSDTESDDSEAIARVRRQARAAREGKHASGENGKAEVMSPISEVSDDDGDDQGRDGSGASREVNAFPALTWARCEFSSHPRVLLVALPRSLYSVDLREPIRKSTLTGNSSATVPASTTSPALTSTSARTVKPAAVAPRALRLRMPSYQLDSFSFSSLLYLPERTLANEPLLPNAYTGLACAPLSDPFRFAVSTRSHVYLHDERYPTVPLLQWPIQTVHARSSARACQLQFSPEGLVAYDTVYNDVTLYPYAQPSAPLEDPPLVMQGFRATGIESTNTQGPARSPASVLVTVAATTSSVPPSPATPALAASAAASRATRLPVERPYGRGDFAMTSTLAYPPYATDAPLRIPSFPLPASAHAALLGPRSQQWGLGGNGFLAHPNEPHVLRSDVYHALRGLVMLPCSVTSSAEANADRRPAYHVLQVRLARLSFVFCWALVIA